MSTAMMTLMMQGVQVARQGEGLERKWEDQGQQEGREMGRNGDTSSKVWVSSYHFTPILGGSL